MTTPTFDIYYKGRGEYRFEWDADKAASNFAKHGVTFEQAITLFDDPDSLERYDAAHSQNEERYRRIGLSDIGILLVVYTVRRAGQVNRIISARRASSREKREYNEEKRKN